MLRQVLTAMPVMFACLLLQGAVVAFCLRQYARFRRRHEGSEPLWLDIVILSLVMLLTILCNFVQMAVWAMLFLSLGEFPDYTTALYHSAVNFATLGYGDIVMSKDWRMLGPIEAAHGILMFGLSTAVMTAAVLDVVKYNMAAIRGETGG